MKTEFNDSLNRKLEQASLAELMPGFDAEQEWAQLSGRLHPAAKTTNWKYWKYAAAIVLLVSTAGIFFKENKQNTNTIASTFAPANDTLKEWMSLVNDGKSNEQQAPKENYKREDIVPVSVPEMKKKTVDSRLAAKLLHHESSNLKLTNREHQLIENYNKKEYICNGTPCPLQICITQTLQCPSKTPAKIASCSTLQPDQSGQIKFKDNKKTAKECKLTVDEITITRINTGETIVLNSNSSPSTAQDMFNYITGAKEGDLLTGIFHSDCDNNSGNQSLKIDNNYGSLIIE